MIAGSLDVQMVLDAQAFMRDIEQARRTTNTSATGMATDLDQVRRTLNTMAEAEKARANIFSRGWQETKRLFGIATDAVDEHSTAVQNLKKEYQDLFTAQKQAADGMDKLDKAAYAVGAGMGVGIDKAKKAWDEFKSWTERTVVIWGVALATGIAAGVLSAVYAVYKSVNFAIGLLTGESYKSANIDALIAANTQVKELQGSLHIGATEATALGDALRRLGVPKDDYVSVWNAATGAMRTNGDELDRLGIQYKDANGNLLSQGQFLQNVKSKLDEYRDGWDRAQAATSIGVGSYDKVVAVLKVTQAEVQRSSQRINDYNLGIGPETQKAVDEYQAAMREFNNESQLTSDGFKRAIADNIMPILTDLATFFREGFPIAVNAFRYSLATVMSLLYGLKTVAYMVSESVVGSLSSIGSIIGALGMAAAKALTGDFSGAKNELLSGWEDAKARLALIGDNIVAQARHNADAMRLAWAMDDRATGAPAALGGGKPWVPPPKPPDPTKAAAVDVYAQLISKIKEATAANELEAQQEKALTQAQKFQLDIQKLVADGKITQAQATSKLTTETLKEFDASEKAAKAARDFAKSLADNAAAWNKIIDDSEASSNKLQDDTRAQLDHNAAIGLGAVALADLEAERLRDKAALLDHQAEVWKTIDLSGATSATLQEEAKHWRELADAKQKGAAKQEDYDRLKQVWQSVDQSAHDAFTHIFENGRDTFQRLADTLKATVLDVLYQMTIRPWIIQMVAGMTSSPVSIVSQALGAGSGKGSGISSLAGLGSLGSSLGTFGSGFSAGLSGLFGEAGFSGSMSAGMTALGAGNIAGGLGTMAGAALPYLGAALLAAQAFGLFKHGGPKTESGFGYGIDRTPNPAAAQAIADGIQKQYASMVTGLGGTAGNLDLGVFTAQDPAGTALTQLQVAAALNGSSIYSRAARMGGTENVGRSDADLQAAITEETQRVVLEALQKSGLTGAVGDYLKQLGNIDQLSGGDLGKAMTHIQQAQALAAKLYDLTATEEEKLAKQRQQELAGLDDLNKVTAQRIYAIEDEAKAQAAAANALQKAIDSSKAAMDFVGGIKTNVRAYLDKLNGTPAGMLAPETQLGNAQSAFDRQLALARSGDRDALQGITGYADQLISAQTAYTASGPQTAAVIDYVKSQLGALGGVKSDAEYIADAVKSAADGTNAAIVSALGLTNNTIANSASAVGGNIYDAAATTDGWINWSANTIWNGLWGTNGLLASKFDTLDTTANGLLDANELKAALGPMATDDMIRQIIAHADTNGDGMISKEEAIKAAVDYNTAATVTATVASAQTTASAVDAAPTKTVSWNDYFNTPGQYGWGTLDPLNPFSYQNSYTVPGHAGGGMASGWSWVGEQGPELAYFGQPAMIYPNSQSMAMAGDGGSDIADRLDALGQKVERLIAVTGAGFRGTIDGVSDVADNTARTKLDSLLAESAHR